MSLKILESIKVDNFRIENLGFLFVVSMLISLPIIALGSNLIFAIPVLIALLFSIIYGERFVIAIVLITLFTLVGEFNPSLRLVIQIVDFSILGYFFLNKFGLEFDNYKRIPKSVAFFLFLYGIAFLLSSAMSDYPFAGMGIFAKQAIFFIIAYIFYSLIDDVVDIKNFFIPIAIVAVIFTTIFIFIFIEEGYDLISIISTSRVRITALTGNMEAATNFYVISFPLVITFIMSQKHSIGRSAGWFILFYSIIGLTLAMSRSAILGIVLSTAIIYFLLRRRKFYKLLFIVMTVLLLFVVIDPLNEIVTQLFRIEEGVSARDYLWLMAVNIIKDHPVFGLGPGAYPYAMYNYYPFMLNDFFGQVFIFFSEASNGVNLAHNIFLVFFSDMGILGLATIVTLPIVYFQIGIKTIKKYKNSSEENYYIIVGLFAAGTSVIFRNFLNSIGLLYIGGIFTDLPFWLVFSSIIYFYRTPLVNANFPRED